ncbi:MULTISPECIES: TIGR00282 family metallophosphoesterase [Aliarcobacter]|uniref:TIGR00282 family metallophosphoesterase n=1 Tax=Aliarcobacter skirrowii TaxID=28200 RepID=A0AAW9D8H0_9BACT|nr:TIGR00282 family metallophosphoesterase [Aliarcobacter skirrowii]AZL53395.1 YmdB family metallophosphoesterase [Aliarcobacter skirrowii]MDD2507876.1 TIGR00282 family metallophosphoesterase [Aliarcobacter skirrowii]MDD3496436.1 TIGR00282 family metallophosphoesterase [Aliarcobacter skirrowii]MDX4068544.1 TIGR00282 family metallophosphoesterase [Aliarcobacter skirrowii]
MRIGFIGDIVGRPGRKIIKESLKHLRAEYKLDLVIANGENASHGFGLTVDSAKELFSSGVDVITGGNHSFDKKKDLQVLLENKNILRPHNYPDGVVGTGLLIKDVQVEDHIETIAVLNLMGQYSMPLVENPFNLAKKVVDDLIKKGVKNIFVDFHGEATSEKRVMLMMFKNQVSAICGTHTHVGTDDLQIFQNTAYLTDIGLTGCYDNVIGMDEKAPIQRATTGIGSHFDVPNSCKAILQMMVVDIENGVATNSFKLKKFCNSSKIYQTDAIVV